MTSDLYEKLSKLRLMAAVMYDQCSAASMTEEQKQDAIEPLRLAQKKLIHDSIRNDLPGVIAAIRNYEEDEACDLRKARRHQEKANEARYHAETILEHLKNDMITHGHVERVQGNYMVVYTNDKIEIR